MKRTSAKRKLVSETVLADCYKLSKLGVPVSRILRDKNLDITRQALAKLIELYGRWETAPHKDCPQLHSSLFPSWLNHESEQVQTNPDGWTYTGYFPFGAWSYED